MITLEGKLHKRKTLGNLRKLHVSKDLIDFASSDYLGLARSPILANNIFKEYTTHQNRLNGFGSTGSRLLTGNTQYALDLEDRIAAFHGHEAGTLFGCGYMANVGLISTIAGSRDVILFDVQVHASMRDGLRLSKARGIPFRHNDLMHLEMRLKNCQGDGNRFICVESIYSTDGSQAPLKEIVQLAKKHNAHLIVDEAHAVGVYGPQGRGLVAEYGLTDSLFAQVVTFGKALGAYGAIVLGDCILKQSLINFATPYIYTTAPPLLSLMAIKCSYDLFPQMDEERLHIHRLIQLFGGVSITAIQSIKIPGNDNVRYAAQKMMEAGYDVRALMSPTVRQGHEVLRICLHAYNTEQEVESFKRLFDKDKGP